MQTSVDQELDRLVEKRAQIGDAEAREMLWKAGVVRHDAQIRRRNRALWFAHFCQMAEKHAWISKDYERRAEEFCESEATKGAA